jgi:hypothetical protein
MKLKRSTIVTMALVGGLMVVAPSCKKKGCMDATATNYDPEAEKDDKDNPCVFPDWYTIVDVNGTSYNQVTGTITGNRTMDAASNWLLSGGVFVGDGATLTIEAGTMVKTADDGTVPFLSVSQGGTINACGTASAPIVFTPMTSTPAPGDWGGIILNGYANINTGATAEGEGGTGTYGGTDNADNSGSLCYVRVEYAGKLLSTDNELNGFSFNGVGSATTLNHLQAYKGADDGIEFFGGAANLSNAVSTGNQDDSFDWTHGWIGTGTNWIVEQDPANGDRGIEADNNGDNNAATPMSKPTLSKITLTGRGAAEGKDGMKLREGTAGLISNVLIDGFKDAVDIQHDVTVANVTSGDLDLSNITANNCTNNFSISATVGTDSTNAATEATNAVNGSGTGADSGWTSGWTKAL